MDYAVPQISSEATAYIKYKNDELKENININIILSLYIKFFDELLKNQTKYPPPWFYKL